MYQFNEFEPALQHMQDTDGVMCYYPANGCCRELWMVGDPEEVSAMVTCELRIAVDVALTMGGLTTDARDCLLAGLGRK
jgi:hypothetical protein